jgi:hypothetical protein
VKCERGIESPALTSIPVRLRVVPGLVDLCLLWRAEVYDKRIDFYYLDRKTREREGGRGREGGPLAAAAAGRPYVEWPRICIVLM